MLVVGVNEVCFVLLARPSLELLQVDDRSRIHRPEVPATIAMAWASHEFVKLDIAGARSIHPRKCMQARQDCACDNLTLIHRWSVYNST